jgi:NLR family CARD domain-containing protein 3
MTGLVNLRLAQEQQLKQWGHYEEAVPAIAQEIWKTVFENLSVTELIPLTLSCKQLHVIATASMWSHIHAEAFGKQQWEWFFGDVGDEPPLPPDIVKIWISPCPFWQGKKVFDTHFLTLIPKTVDRNPLTLNSLGELIQHPKQGEATKYSYYWEDLKNQYGTQPVGASHWVLMTRDVIPGSRGKRYADQQQLLTKADPGYEVPAILNATAAILMAYFAKGERLYGDSPWTYTRCQEKVSYQSFVGGFVATGLDVNDYDSDNGHVGLAALRKFF